MKVTTTLLCVLFSLASTVHAQEAKPYTAEVSGSATASFANIFLGDNKDDAQQVSVTGRYNEFLNAQWELGTFISFGLTHSQISSTNTELAVLVGPTYNFNTDIANSFFVRAGVGVRFDWLSGSDSATRFAYEVAFGKRIELAKNISWAPTLRAVGFTSKTFSNGDKYSSRVDLNVVPLQFSLLFP